MRFLKNYWFRWFIGAFAIGAILPPLLFFGLSFYLHVSTLAQFQSQGIPAVLITNPFIDITDPRSGKVIASGSSALAIAVLLCGICAGILGLGIAAVKRLIRKSPS